MSTISYTEPSITTEQEKRENDEFTEEVKRVIKNEMYGRDMSKRDDQNSNMVDVDVNGDALQVPQEEEEEAEDRGSGGVDDNNNDNQLNHNNGDDTDITEELLDRFDECLDEIPVEDKVDYLNALVEVPDIVETESNPSQFLRAENYNPTKAALRLVKYWEMRCDIFLEDAFKPMTMNGACNSVADTIVNIPTLFHILPNDDYGRVVFCYDRTHVSFKDHDPIVLVKIAWFAMHRAIQRESIQQRGLVWIGINRSSSMWDTPKRTMLRLCWKSLEEALPLKVNCYHICFSSLVFKFVLPFTKLLLSPESRRRMKLHTSSISATPTIIKEMKEFGLHPENLPKSIGGSYNKKPSWITDYDRVVKDRYTRRRRNQHERQRNQIAS